MTEIALNRGYRRQTPGARALSQQICQNENVNPLLNWLDHPTKRKPQRPFPPPVLRTVRKG